MRHRAMRYRALALAGSLLLALPLAWAGQPAAQFDLAAHAKPAAGSTPAHTTAVRQPKPPKHAAKPTGATRAWTALPAERTFPADSGMLNVKTVFGAVGDGVHDDTAALQAAITATIRQQNTSRILYFPAGTYLVTKPLQWKNPSGGFDAELTLQGENQGTTVIKLSNHNALFQNSTAPNSVIQTNSLNPSGADAANGGGNNGFDNYLFDLTVDTGTGNPGANAVNFIGNNYCGLRNVTLRSSDPDHVGVAGLAMARYATGPCLMKDVSVDGFQYGVESARQEYSITFENLALKNQQVAGILNTDNVLSIENLTSQNKVPAIENFGSSPTGLSGLVTLIGATLSGGDNSICAIQNFQTLYARDVVTTGYRSAISDAQMRPVPGTSVTEYDSGPTYTQFGGAASSLNLPIEQTPEFEETDPSKWASVVAFGADPTGAADSAAAVQKAIDSGATTVYFPAGRYILNSPVTVRGNVRVIDGFDSRVVPNGSTYTTASATRNPFFVFQNSNDVIVDHIRFGNASVSYPGLVYLQDDSSHAVTIEDSAFDRLDPGNVYQNGVSGTGDVFIENVVGAGWNILHPQHVYARQFDPEGAVQKVENDGGTLWILGIKTERASDDTHTAAVINTQGGGSTELLGGLIYPVVAAVPVNQAAFVVQNSRASFVYAVSVHNPLNADPGTPDGDFKTQVKEIQGDVTSNLASTTVFAQTPRGPQGVMMPLYTSKP